MARKSMFVVGGIVLIATVVSLFWQRPKAQGLQLTRREMEETVGSDFVGCFDAQSVNACSDENDETPCEEGTMWRAWDEPVGTGALYLRCSCANIDCQETDCRVYGTPVHCKKANIIWTRTQVPTGKCSGLDVCEDVPSSSPCISGVIEDCDLQDRRNNMRPDHMAQM